MVLSTQVLLSVSRISKSYANAQEAAKAIIAGFKDTGFKAHLADCAAAVGK